MQRRVTNLSRNLPEKSVTATLRISPVSFIVSHRSFLLFEFLQSAMEAACASQAAKIDRKEREMESSTPALGSRVKNAEMKETSHSNRSSMNKFALQIKKPSHRKSISPISWFPRKKADSFLKRKIRLLQEGGGMSLSLVETLGNASPHYTRIAREKIAAQEAASRAMEACKAAMVEASWCRILQAARIQSKEAESKLEKADQYATAAFEEAKLIGVMMFDRPNCPKRPCQVSSSHAVTASFETEFEVDREVTAAVRKAFLALASRSSTSNKEEFRDLLRKIRQNPEDYESECQGTTSSNSSEALVDMMVDRLKELPEEGLSSLATIVATCGLNAALLEMQKGSQCPSEKDKESEASLPGLEKFLVKHVSRLEREVQEAQLAKKNDAPCSSEHDKQAPDDAAIRGCDDLGSILVKHVSKLQREIQAAKNSQKQKSSAPAACQEELREITNGNGLKSSKLRHEACSEFQQTSLYEVLVKPVHWLEREKSSVKERTESLEDDLVKHQPRLERVNSIKHVDARREAREKELQEAWGGLSLGNSLKPHFSKLERDKAAWRRAEQERKFAEETDCQK